MPSYIEQNSASPTALRRVLFVALAIAALVLAAVYGREEDDGILHAAQTAVVDATGSVSSVGAGMGAATEGVATALGDATANPNTLEGLRQQNEELREMLAEAEEYRQEVDRLRGLLDIKQVSGVTGPVARVIGSSTNAWDQSITIDLGTEDGVVSGMTVMGATGVIGQVSQAGERSSTVRLLTDPNSGAAVMVQSSRANGIVRGSLSGLLYLEDVDEDQIPVAGDVIVTSGLGGSYERGLIVGAVASVGDATSGADTGIVINPNASAKMLEEVIVVFKAPTVADSAKSGASAATGANAGENGDGSQMQAQEGDSEYADEDPTLIDVTATSQEEQDMTYVEGDWQGEEGAAGDEDFEGYDEESGVEEGAEY